MHSNHKYNITLKGASTTQLEPKQATILYIHKKNPSYPSYLAKTTPPRKTTSYIYTSKLGKKRSRKVIITKRPQETPTRNNRSWSSNLQRPRFIHPIQTQRIRARTGTKQRRRSEQTTELIPRGLRTRVWRSTAPTAAAASTGATMGIGIQTVVVVVVVVMRCRRAISIIPGFRPHC